MNLIKSDWYLSYSRDKFWGNQNKYAIDTQIWAQGLNFRIARLLAQCPPVVATFEAVPEEVLGWACRDQKTIHYLYVKKDFRRQGIGKFLTFGADTYTHLTKKGVLLLKDLKYNPFLLELLP